MSLTILSDSDVREILDNLTAADVESLQKSMRQALHEYSTGTQNDDACAMHQPGRTVVGSQKHGTTSLFMPSTSSAGIGVKVVTLPTFSTSTEFKASNAITTPQGALALMNSTGQPFGFLNASEITAFRTALASSLLISRRSKIHTITIFGSGKQAYWHIRLALILRGPSIRHINIIVRQLNLRSKSLLKSFLNIPAETKAKEGWTNCKFGVLSSSYGEFDRMSKEQIRAADIILCTTPSTQPLFDDKILTNTEGRRKGRLIIAIGSYKPHMIEVPTEILIQATKTHRSGHHFHKHAEEGRVVVVDTINGCLEEAGEIIQAKLNPKQVVELGEIALLEGLEVPEEIDGSPTSSRVSMEGLQIDDLKRPALASVFGENGSSTSSLFGNSNNERSRSTSPSSSIRRSFSGSLAGSRGSGFFLHHRRTGSSGSVGGNGKKERGREKEKEEDEMGRWLRKGNVVYKSVGMGLMDLVVGVDLVRLAGERGVGSVVEGF